MSHCSVPWALLLSCPPQAWHRSQGSSGRRQGARQWGTLQDAVQMKAQTVCVCFA